MHAGLRYIHLLYIRTYLIGMLKLLLRWQSPSRSSGGDHTGLMHLQTDPGRRPTPAMLAAHPFVAGAQLPAGLVAAITANADMQPADEQTEVAQVSDQLQQVVSLSYMISTAMCKAIRQQHLHHCHACHRRHFHSAISTSRAGRHRPRTSRQTACCPQLAHRTAYTATRSGRWTWRHPVTVQQLQRVWQAYSIPAMFRSTLHAIIQVRLV